MPYDQVCPPVKMIELVQYCKSNRLRLILGCDSNAHHTLWGSSNINPRGEQLCEYIGASELCCINRGHKPTFVVANRQEVIDITLVSVDLINCVMDWWVDDEPSLSDHRIIRAVIKLGKPQPIHIRNKKKTDWGFYKSRVIPRLSGIDNMEISSVDEIDMVVDNITAILNDGFKEACPEKVIKPRGRIVPWWNKTLGSLRRETRRSWRTHMLIGTSETWSAYCAVRNRYTSELKKAKRESWEAYCTDIKSCSEASRLHRVLKVDQVSRLGRVQKEDGAYTSDLAESLILLLVKHFPSDPKGNERGPQQEVNDIEVVNTIVTPELVVRAISTFGPYKAAGRDGIFPRMLKTVKHELSKPLTVVMRACLTHGYTPKRWRETKVCFLPKPGKGSYERANSWRPVPLTSFLLKTLERMIDWFVRDPDLIGRLRKNNRFAYMAGVSTESAIHQIVARAEATLKSNESAIAVLLDIRGAFNEATFRSIESGLFRHGVSPVCVIFISHMLRHRIIYTAEGELSRAAERGCPQGGVLSPLLWNLVVDEVLEKLKNSLPQVYSNGYADDLAMIARGPDLSTVTQHAHAAIDLVSKWSRDVDLGVEGDKAAAILFTRKRKGVKKLLTVEGTQLPYVTSAKYLGVTIYNKLTWRAHCTDRAKKAVMALAVCKRAIGPKWGLSPKKTLWIYKSIVRPGIEYGAVVWCACSKVQATVKLLEKAQRVTLLSTAGTMRSVSTAGLECLLGVVPIDIRIQQVALQTMHRLRLKGQWLGWNNRGYKGPVSHMDFCTNVMKEVPEMSLPCDKGGIKLSPSHNFSITFRSRVEWNDSGFRPGSLHGWCCFTDGSRSKHGIAGSGYFGW